MSKLAPPTRKVAAPASIPTRTSGPIITGTPRPEGVPRSFADLERAARAGPHLADIPVRAPARRSKGGPSPAPVQAKAEEDAPEAVQAEAVQAEASGTRGPSPSPSVREAAKLGTSGASQPLPYLDAIQRSFGRHDVSGIEAHTDSKAAEGSREMGAAAFTTGKHVAFAGSPGLRTAAHEAAHVIQQRAGVQLEGGVGQVNDRYEQHADAVANLVVRGQSSASLLDRFAPPAGAEGAAPSAGEAVQRFPVTANWTAPNNFTGGTGMSADIGRTGEWKRGTKPKANTPPVIKTVGKIVGGKHRYIAGHLLNAEMGGLGEHKNLTVLSDKANKAHSGLELKVKALAEKADQIHRGVVYDDPNYEYGVNYSVVVRPAAPLPSAPYHGNERKLASALTVNIRPIRKTARGVSSAWPGQPTVANRRVVNVPPYPAAPVVRAVTPTEQEVIDAVNATAIHGVAVSLQTILAYVNANRPAHSPRMLLLTLRKAVQRALQSGRIKQGRGHTYKRV
jgi:hypothetical protein